MVGFPWLQPAEPGYHDIGMADRQIVVRESSHWDWCWTGAC